MLVLRLLVLQLYDLFVEFIAVALHPVFLLFHGFQRIFVLDLDVFRGLCKFFRSLFFSRELVLGLAQTCLVLLHALADFLSEVNVSDALLHHEVH